MKLARTDTPGFDCFILLTDGLLDKAEFQKMEKKIFDKYGKITVYNASSRKGEDDLWTTNRYGLDHNRHDSYQDVDFEFALFKNLNEYI